MEMGAKWCIMRHLIHRVCKAMFEQSELYRKIRIFFSDRIWLLLISISHKQTNLEVAPDTD